MMAVASGEQFDCDNYNPLICTADAIMYCLTNGTIVVGRCHAQRAVCVEKKTLDTTFAACNQKSSDRFNCDNPLVCTKDLIPFCLRNGTVVRGTCSAKQAVCRENQQIDNSFNTCNRAILRAKSPTNTKQTGGNSAATMSATIVSLLLGLFASVLF